jgi:hypothetical protein
MRYPVAKSIRESTLGAGDQVLAKHTISLAELRTPHGALEHGQLLTECQILERNRSVSTTDQRERSKGDDERSQHESFCPAISHRINRGRRSDSGERQL